PRPIKWFSIPRLFRAENPQRGRFREFLQWNIDVIGSDDVQADVECIFTCADFLREVGLTPDDVVIRIGARPLTMAMLRSVGVGEDGMDKALAVLDKRPKVDEERFAAMAADVGIGADGVEAVCRFQDAADLDEVAAAVGESAGEDVQKLKIALEHLDLMGAGDYCRLDMRIVRGLAYYTGIVYEVFDAAEDLRAVAGGGRYDNLLEVLGGPKIGATGFGMGDPVLSILLAEKGKLPDFAAGVDCFVVAGGDDVSEQMLQVVGGLRRAGVATDYSSKRNLGKALKEANRRKARYAVIVRTDGVAVKSLQTGDQVDVPIEELLENPAKYFK
ncbi:hypothetical protein LCGC14_1956770, partial [marine sediment metagenome]